MVPGQGLTAFVCMESQRHVLKRESSPHRARGALSSEPLDLVQKSRRWALLPLGCTSVFLHHCYHQHFVCVLKCGISNVVLFPDGSGYLGSLVTPKDFKILSVSTNLAIAVLRGIARVSRSRWYCDVLTTLGFLARERGCLSIDLYVLFPLARCAVFSMQVFCLLG